MPEKVKPIQVGVADGPSLAGWHKIEAYLRCPKEWQLAHVRHVSPGIAGVKEDEGEKSAFAIGRLFHLVKAHWFASQFDTSESTMQRIRDLCYEEALKGDKPILITDIASTLRYFEEYVNHYKPLPKPEVIAAEYDVGPAPLTLGDPENTWRTARLDDVSRYPEANGKLCIGESKTTSAPINWTVEQYKLHGQPMLQALLWRTSEQGEKMHGPIAGVMLDIIQKGYDKPSKFGRAFIPLSNVALDWYARNLRKYIERALATKWESDAPRNISNCTRMVGRMRLPCAFRELCTYGKSASSQYNIRGTSLLSPENERNGVRPWD